MSKMLIYTPGSEVLQEIRMIVAMDSWDTTIIPIIGQIAPFDSLGRITLREIGTDAWTQRQVTMLTLFHPGGV